MCLGGGRKARAFAISVALLLARCDLSPHPEDPGLDKGTHGGSSQHATDAGSPIINGSGGSTAPTTSGAAGSNAGGVPKFSDSGIAPHTPDAGASPDAGTDSGAIDAGTNADADAH